MGFDKAPAILKPWFLASAFPAGSLNHLALEDLPEGDPMENILHFLARKLGELNEWSQEIRTLNNEYWQLKVLICDNLKRWSFDPTVIIFPEFRLLSSCFYDWTCSLPVHLGGHEIITHISRPFMIEAAGDTLKDDESLVEAAESWLKAAKSWLEVAETRLTAEIGLM